MVNRASVHVCSIKAIFPPINYGGEPSVPMGIVSQLPSSHLSIHRVPAKLRYRIMPYGETPAGYGSCFCWFTTDRASSGGSDKSVDASPPCSALPVGNDAVSPTPSFTGSFSRTLPDRLLSSASAGP